MHEYNSTVSRKDPIHSLQGGRAIAAMMVVVFHLHVFVLPERIYASSGDGVHTAAAMGYAGVEFFFALSGFLMAYVHQADWGMRNKAGPYLRKRIARIYPAYWLVVIPLIALGALIPSIGAETVPSFGEIVRNLLLTPSELPPILAVAWTLQYELVFYFIFVLTILFGRFGLTALGIWGGFCLLNFFATFPGLLGSFFLSAYNLIFLFGIASALLYGRLRVNQARLLTISGMLVFFGAGLLEAYDVVIYRDDIRTLFYGVAAAATIAGLSALEAQGKIKCPNSLKVVGDASYMLYLAHMPVFTATAIVLVKLNVGAIIPPWLMTIILLGYSIIVSIVLHYLFEKPMVRQTNRVIGQFSRAVSALVNSGARHSSQKQR